MLRALSISLLLASMAALAASFPLVGEWTAPTKNTDGSAIASTITYNVYQGPQGGTFTMVQTGLKGTSAVISAGLPAGSTQCFYVTAVTNLGESAPSNSACVSIPSAKPNAPTNLSITLGP